MADKVSGTDPVGTTPRLHNKIVDSMNAHERERTSKPVKPQRAHISQTSVEVRNNSGGHLARGSVLRVNGDILTGLPAYAAETLWFGGSVPNTDKKYGILRTATRSGDLGELQVAGVCIARLLVEDESHEYAKPVDGETYLESCESGPFVILDKKTGGGEVEAVVVFRSDLTNILVRFELTEILLLGGEADAVIVGFGALPGGYTASEEAIIVKDFTDTPGSWQGAVGFRGWATLPEDNDDGKYEIVWMETFAKFIEFTSSSPMAEGEMNVSDDQWFDIKEPTSDPITATDIGGLFKRALPGAKGQANYNPKTDKYVIHECQTKAGQIDFELTSDFSAGQATATVTRWYGTQQDMQQPPEGPVTVWDEDTIYPRALIGCKGTAVLDAEADKFRVTKCQQMAQRISGTIPDTLECGLEFATVSFEVDVEDIKVITFSPFDKKPEGVVSEGEEAAMLTIYNAFGWSAEVGAYWHAEWHETDVKWKLYQIVARCADPEDCPPEE